MNNSTLFNEIINLEQQVLKLKGEKAELLEALQEMLIGDKEAIEEAELLGIPFPEPMLASYKKIVAVIAKNVGEQA